MLYRGLQSVVCLLLCTGLPASANAQQAPLSQAAFDSTWTVAFEANDVGASERLIRSHRLLVKPLVDRLVRESLVASLVPDEKTARAIERRARAAAGQFESAFEERSLTIAVSYLDRWEEPQRGAKLEADSLYDAATSKRGRAETREEAADDYRRALHLYRSIGDERGEGAALGGLGFVAWYQGDADQVRSYFEQALEVRLRVDDRELVGNSYNDLGSVQRGFFRDYERALDFYRKAEEIRMETGDVAGLAKTRSYIGSTLEILGRLEEAHRAFERAADAALSVADSTSATSALLSSGVVLTELGKHSDALDRLTRALALTASAAAADDRIDVLNWIGVVHRRLGDFEAALESYGAVLERAEREEDASAAAYAHSNIGVVYLSAERPERAKQFFEQALAEFEELDDREGRLSALINLGSSDVETGSFDAGKTRANEAIDLARELGDRPREATALILLGNALERANLPEEALPVMSEGVELARSLAIPNLIWTGLMGLGEIAERSAAYEEALARYEEAFDVLEATRAGLTTDEDKAGFLAQQRYLYEDVLHLMNKLHEQQPDAGYEVRALNFAERAKARAFLDLLAEALADVESGVDPDLLERQSSVLRDISDVRAGLQDASNRGDEPTRAMHAQRLADLEDAYEQLKRDLRRSNPRYSELKYPEPVTIEALQRETLDASSVLVEYALGDSSSTMWVVTRSSVEMYRLPRAAHIERQVEILRYALEHPADASPTSFAKAAGRLYATLLSPARDRIPAGSNLVIVPDGILHYLPFEVLVTDSSASVSFTELPYLIRSHAVSYAQSAGVIHQLRRSRSAHRGGAQNRLLAVGDPIFDPEEGRDDPEYRVLASSDAQAASLQRLPYTGEEVRAISSYFPASASNVLLREAATESGLKAQTSLEDYRYIHFATHGLINEKRPDFSGLVLGVEREGEEDGLLQAAEIFDLRLDADLVVLSACQTGLGTIVRGEGMVGLTRAFMYAGAPSLFVSLWSVADASTSQLMQRFYEALVEGGATKAVAAQEARLFLLRSERFAHPFYWAPFVLIGDWQ